MSSIETPEQMNDDGRWSLWRDALRRLYKNKPATISAFLLGLMALGALMTPLIAPYDYEVQVTKPTDLFYVFLMLSEIERVHLIL